MRRILVQHHQPDDFRDALEARFPEVEFNYAATPDEIADKLAAFAPEVVFSIKGPELPGEHHALALATGSVKWIHVGGSGYEHLQPFDPTRVTMTNSAGILARHLAETATGAMLALNGNLLRYRDQQRAANWHPLTFAPLSAKTLAVIGLGAIGSWMAHNARALGMRVLAVRRRQDAVDNVDALYPPEKLHEVLAQADVVSLHVRASPETHHMMNTAAFAAMKPGALFLNTSRGSVVDTRALIAALEHGHLGAAYLDVFEQEPLPGDHPLWARDDVLITPHASDNIENWPLQFALFFADNLERWLKDEPLVNLVAP